MDDLKDLDLNDFFFLIARTLAEYKRRTELNCIIADYQSLNGGIKLLAKSGPCLEPDCEAAGIDFIHCMIQAYKQEWKGNNGSLLIDEKPEGYEASLTFYYPINDYIFFLEPRCNSQDYKDLLHRLDVSPHILGFSKSVRCLIRCDAITAEIIRSSEQVISFGPAELADQDDLQGAGNFLGTPYQRTSIINWDLPEDLFENFRNLPDF